MAHEFVIGVLLGNPVSQNTGPLTRVAQRMLTELSEEPTVAIFEFFETKKSWKWKMNLF